MYIEKRIEDEASLAIKELKNLKLKNPVKLSNTFAKYIHQYSSPTSENVYFLIKLITAYKKIVSKAGTEMNNLILAWQKENKMQEFDFVLICLKLVEEKATMDEYTLACKKYFESKYLSDLQKVLDNYFESLKKIFEKDIRSFDIFVKVLGKITPKLTQPKISIILQKRLKKQEYYEILARIEKEVNEKHSMILIRKLLKETQISLPRHRRHPS